MTYRRRCFRCRCRQQHIYLRRLFFSTSTSTHTRYIYLTYIYDGKFQNYASIIFISLLSLQYFIESGLKFFRFRVCVCYVVVLFIIIF